MLRFAAISLLFLFQTGHEGQPESCNNYLKNVHKCECQRATKCEHERSAQEDSKCQTYCRKEACRCIDRCTS